MKHGFSERFQWRSQISIEKARVFGRAAQEATTDSGPFSATGTPHQRDRHRLSLFPGDSADHRSGVIHAAVIHHHNARRPWLNRQEIHRLLQCCGDPCCLVIGRDDDFEVYVGAMQRDWMSPCLKTTPPAGLNTMRVKRNHLNLQYPGTVRKLCSQYME
jgi:hypothetical protein